MNSREREPLTPEERDLARRLARLGGHAEPPAALDARILAAAHAAVARSATRRRPRWPLGLGLAASLALALGVAWQLHMRPGALPLPTDEAPAGTVARTADAVQPPPAAEPPPPAQAPASPVAMRPSAQGAPAPEVRHAPPPAAVMQAPPGADAATQARAREAAELDAAEHARTMRHAAVEAERAATEAFRARQAVAPPPPPPPAGEPGAEASAPPSAPLLPPPSGEEKPLEVEAVPAPAPAAQVAAPAPPAPPERAISAAGTSAGTHTLQADQPDDVQPPASFDAPEARDAWLQRIRELLHEGDRDAARASLLEFRRRYPQHSLPDDLLPLLEE